MNDSQQQMTFPDDWVSLRVGYGHDNLLVYGSRDAIDACQQKLRDCKRKLLAAEVWNVAVSNAMQLAQHEQVALLAEAYKKCAITYLHWLAVSNPENSLAKDIRNADMVGAELAAAIAAQQGESK